jgi:hypothetical protein
MAGGGTKTRVKIRCHECGNKFYHPNAYPEACPLCGVEFEADPGDVIRLPALHGATAATPDKVFREMEAKSIERAETAASMAGVPVSEMSHLKITDLRDNVQPGETYYKPPTVAREMRGLGGFQANGADYAAAAHTGYAPHAGAKALGQIQKVNGRG